MKTTDSNHDSFQPPRHWMDMEELTAQYWADEKAQTVRGQEFSHKPIETLELLERLDSKGHARRDFLTLMGASMALASFACVRKPVTKVIPYVVKPEEVIPGVAVHYASKCGECSTGCGVLVKTREGRPIKMEGNPDDPVSGGKLCSKGQASVLNLYDPERLRGPVRVDRASGTETPASWDELDAWLSQKWSQAGRVAVLSSPVTGPTTRRAVQEFLKAFRSSTWVEYEPLHHEELSEAQAASYGDAIVPDYRFEDADVVVSFGADFLATWISPVEHARDWAKARRLKGQSAAGAKMSRHVQFESMLSVTGASADERFAVKPGDELRVALAIAHHLLITKKVTGYAQNGAATGVLRAHTPEKVAQQIGNGLTAEKIIEIADLLWASRGKSLVVAGGSQTRTEDGLQLQVAVNFLNSILENEGATVDGTSRVRAAHSSYKDLKRLIAEMKSGTIDVLVLYRTNPAYALPKDLGWEEALAKVPTVVAVADRVDETAAKADVVLPDHHPLENWGDGESKAGLFTLQQPTVAPLFDTRAFQDSLLVWARRAGLRVSGLLAQTKDRASDTWHEYLKNSWKEQQYKRASGGLDFETFWVKTLQKGVLDAGAGRKHARSFKVASLGLLTSYIGASKGIVLAAYEKVSMGDGRAANNAWLQELPDPITTVTWDNYVNVAPSLAEELKLRTGDVVKVKSDARVVELPVNVQPGVHPSVVAVAFGYGRERAGKVGNGVGKSIAGFGYEKGARLVLSGRTVELEKTGVRYQLAATQGHHRTEGRPIVNDITLAEYRKKPNEANHTDPHLRLDPIPQIWENHEYKGYKWGLNIDLAACTGCGACITACQAENNIPVVGRDRIRMGREMHWIRLDRYYSGPAENPDVLFEPMMCQHCDNAPCETVCPVLATVHSDEGLNQMVYNRCVGTRYCQNNCPYKVRRFNFFDHWKDYKESMNLAWNPDVTVRSRGVMEKCTFCIQRIHEAKEKVRGTGQKVADGAVKTACQQTCPTDAIVFGNVNDAKSEVATLVRDPRNFRVLEVLNTKPAVTYLTKVRNKAEGKPHVEHH